MITSTQIKQFTDEYCFYPMPNKLTSDSFNTETLGATNPDINYYILSSLGRGNTESGKDVTLSQLLTDNMVTVLANSTRNIGINDEVPNEQNEEEITTNMTVLSQAILDMYIKELGVNEYTANQLQNYLAPLIAEWSAQAS